MTDPNLAAVLAMPSGGVTFRPLMRATQPTSDRAIARENLISRRAPVTAQAINAEMERIRHFNDPERNR